MDMILRNARIADRDAAVVGIGIDDESPEQAVAKLSPVLCGIKSGRRTVTHQPVVLHRPD